MEYAFIYSDRDYYTYHGFSLRTWCN